MAELLSFDNLKEVLQRYAKQAEEIYKYQIALGGHNASRKLTDTVKATVHQGAKSFEVVLSLQEYWKYIEGGSKGTESSPAGAVYPAHFPPTEAILKWMSVKPIIPQPDASGRIPSPRQLAYLISRAIYKFGQEPFPALQATKEDLEKQFKGEIAKALEQDVKGYLLEVMAGQ